MGMLTQLLLCSRRILTRLAKFQIADKRGKLTVYKVGDHVDIPRARWSVTRVLLEGDVQYPWHTKFYKMVCLYTGFKGSRCQRKSTSITLPLASSRNGRRG